MQINLVNVYVQIDVYVGEQWTMRPRIHPTLHNERPRIPNTVVTVVQCLFRGSSYHHQSLVQFKRPLDIPANCTSAHVAKLKRTRSGTRIDAADKRCPTKTQLSHWRHCTFQRACGYNAGDNKTGQFQLAVPQWGFVGRSPTRAPPSQPSAIGLSTVGYRLRLLDFLHKGRNLAAGNEEEANLPADSDLDLHARERF